MEELEAIAEGKPLVTVKKIFFYFYHLSGTCLINKILFQKVAKTVPLQTVRFPLKQPAAASSYKGE